MTTILHVIDTGGPGGAETVFLNTATGLDSSKFKSICLVSRDGWLADSLRTRGVEPIIRSASGSFNLTYLNLVRSLVRKHKVDVIAAHLYGSAIYCSLAGLLERIPVISVLHGQSDITGKGRFAWVKRWLVRRGSSCTVFVSSRLKMELAAALSLPERRCAVIPNGIELQKFTGGRDHQLRKQLGIGNEHILVGAVGNIRKPKAYEVFIKAAALLRDRSHRYRFAIAGEGSGTLFEQLQKLVSDLQLENTLTFLGLRKDVAQVLHNYDIYVLSSATEGFSIACIEAMASSVPVVATRSGGPEEIVEHESSGLLVPVNDPEQLAIAVDRIAQNNELAHKLTSRALARVHQRYAMSDMLKAYEKLFAQTARRE